jgi:hypothetical protein
MNYGGVSMAFSYKLTWKTHVACLALSVLILLLSYGIVDSVLMDFLTSEKLKYITNSGIPEAVFYLILAAMPMCIVHELFHGGCFKLFGGRVTFGFKGLYAYTRELSGKAFSRNLFIITLLAPLAGVSLLSAFLPGWIGNLILILNLLGSTGDIYMAILLLRFNSEAKIVDREYGFDVVYDK